MKRDLKQLAGRLRHTKAYEKLFDLLNTSTSMSVFFNTVYLILTTNQYEHFVVTEYDPKTGKPVKGGWQLYEKSHSFNLQHSLSDAAYVRMTPWLKENVSKYGANLIHTQGGIVVLTRDQYGHPEASLPKSVIHFDSDAEEIRTDVNPQ